MTRMLVLGGSDEAAVVCEAAERLHCEVVVACPSRGEVAVGEREWIECDVYGDPVTEATRVLRALRDPVDGVVCGCVDAPALAAHIRGSVGYDPRPFIDKTELARRLGRGTVPPSASSYADVVVKPATGRGSRGVSYVAMGDHRGLGAAKIAARAADRDGRCIIQRRIRGTQISTEGAVIRGRYYHVADADRYYPDDARPVEAGGSLPAALTADEHEQVVCALQSAAIRCGVRYASWKGDLCIDERGHVWIFEVTPRLSGGYFSTDQIVRSTGVDLSRVAVLLALGDDECALDAVIAARAAPVAKRLIWAPPGRIVRVDYPPSDGVCRVVEHLRVGDTSIGPGQNWGALATVIGPSVEACEQWVAGVRVEVE